ncbi:hypothetical protein DAMA08_023170 [Martiniozyma asiatica (nom. inval.)]|nr:hypothetical protein DAMA08_023170 [Martiniozyma asiatica]
MSSNYDAKSNTQRCPFYEKAGACRHGSKCVRVHNKPTSSKTVVFWKLFTNPGVKDAAVENLNKEAENEVKYKAKIHVPDFVPTGYMTKEEIDKYVDELYADLSVELAKYGKVKYIAICGNKNQHLTGNVYVKFATEEAAQKCYSECNTRWYDGRPLFCEFSPVVEFDRASCKDFMLSGSCERGHLCNFWHLKMPSKSLWLRCEGAKLSSAKS